MKIMKIIDVHNHLYPKEWMEFLNERPGSLTMKRMDPTHATFYYEGMRLATVSVPGHYDPEARMRDLDRYGIDVQVMSFTTPSVELISAAEGVAWAKKANDYYAEVCRRYKGRLYAYATLPYQDVKESLKELERAYKDLGVRGITLFSNLAGKPVYDPQFFPIYEAAASYDLPLFIHPAPPLTSDAMKRVGMPLPLYAFIFDTTMAVTGLIFTGVFERLPKLKIIHAHLGGVFPYLVGRIDDSFRSYADDYGYSLQRKPSEYYRENVYDDVISFHLPAMKCALEFMGADHLLIGTDYAHPIGDPEKSAQLLEMLNLSQEDKEKIFYKNAEKLFKLG
jgi:aminocarboxymuconate-semialdehyde decarboxylase